MPKRFSSFRAQLTLQWTLVFGVLLIVSLLGIYVAMRRSLYHSLEADLRTIAGTEVASATDGPDVHLHPLDEPAIVNQHYLEKFVQILTPDNAVLKQSSNLTEKRSLVSADVVRQTLAGKSLLLDVTITGLPGRALSLPVEKNDKQFVFVVAVPLSHINEALSTLRLVLTFVGLLALALTALVGYRLATRALRPVDLLTQRAQLIGRDHLKARLAEPQTDDELARLAHVLNEMLDRLYQNLEMHQRFAADASHELRSPLTALRGRIEIALRRERTPAEYKAALENSLGELDHLIHLLEDLLELARADAQQLSLDLREVPLQPLVEAEIQRWQPTAVAHQVALQSAIKGDYLVVADATRLRRVLGNLLDNAIHYSRTSGGKVTISAHNGGGEVWLEVQDNGIGISSEQQAYLFNRFWRANHARQLRPNGVGLGLAICREIVRAHGGEFAVESSIEHGSRFRFSLPSASA